MNIFCHGLKIEFDVQGFQQLRRTVIAKGWATLFYDLRTRQLIVVEGDQTAGHSSFVRVGCYLLADLPSLSLQSIYDRLADVMV